MTPRDDQVTVTGFRFILLYFFFLFPPEDLLFSCFFFYIDISLSLTHTHTHTHTVLQTQKLKTHLLRTQSSEVLPLRPGMGQYIAMHASPTANDLFLASYILLLHSPAFFSNISPEFFLLAVVTAGSCVGPQNKIGHLAPHRQLIQVPVLNAHGI